MAAPSSPIHTDAMRTLLHTYNNFSFLNRLYNSLPSLSHFTFYLPTLSLETLRRFFPSLSLETLRRFFPSLSLETLRRFFSRALAMTLSTSGDYLDDCVYDDDQCFYLVPFRWWSEAWKALFSDSSEMNGVYYLAESKTGRSGSGEFDIVLELSKEDDCRISSGQEGDCALVAEWMFLQAAKRHIDVKEVGHFFSTEDNIPDMFPLMIKLSVSRGSSLLTVRIHQQDNKAASFSKACSIFHVKSGVLGIWDFSGQTTQFLSHEEIEVSNDLFQDNEISLELQVCGSPNLWGRQKDKMEAEQLSTEEFCSSLKMNKTTNQSISNFVVDESSPFGSCYLKIGNLGLTGLKNLGNTCYMSSAIQCLVHTPDLVDYFLGDYKKDINTQNPMGLKGELALKFGELLRKLWVPGARSVAPRALKSLVDDYDPKFRGFDQHDSPDFLASILNKLHEDLNRLNKPHIADESSIIVGLYQGQEQSTLSCQVCYKMSTKFDPFWYMAVPLPQATRVMTLTVFSTDGMSLPCPVTVIVPKNGHAKDLLQALSTACCLKDGEDLLIAEICDCRILQFLDNSTGSLELLRDDDKLVAYILPKERSCLVVFMHKLLESLHSEEYAGTQSSKRFGTPLVAACISNLSAGSQILEAFSRLLSPFLIPVEKDEYDDYDELNSDKEIDKENSMSIADKDLSFDDSNSQPGFEFFFIEGSNLKELKLDMNEPLPILLLTEMFNLDVTWPEKMKKLYNTSLLSNLQQISEQPQEQLSLYKCLKDYLKKEILAEENKWFCSKCEKDQQTSKKLDISRLPKILIIQLKRFTYSSILQEKLETFVDFPVDLDLSTYVLHENPQVSQRYKLYAVTNHYGNFSKGHYTAFVQHGGGGWYKFDDRHVSRITEDQIKTKAAYLLFYRRKAVADI